MSEPGQTDALAAEYVLGTLDADELTQAQALAGADQEFVEKVKRWERRLGELHLMVEPVEPEGWIWERIKSRMPVVSQMPEIPEPTEAAADQALPAAEPTLALVPEVAALDAPAPADAPETVAAPEPASEPPPAETPADVLVPPPPAPMPAEVLPPPIPPPPIPPRPSEQAKPRPAAVPREQIVLRRKLRRWRAWALLMTLLVLTGAGLVGAWTLMPEQLPPVLQPAEVLRLVGIVPETPTSAVRPPAPPESQFDE
jgi:hypothetical protein